ncbi:class D sortase [Rossellomorea marisflavi]|uniref:class D sortase n=1 Tax=Rossellomorea marisflavi TaxID=189381 RepID=UPI00345B3EE0
MRKKTIAGLSLVIIGLILLSIPLYYEWEKGKEEKAMQDALNIIEQADGGEVDLSKVKNLTIPEDQLKKVLELEIPFLDFKEKILPEATQENLSVALAQIKQNQTPGKGNFTIAGHRGYRGDRHFRQLPEVPTGETVILHVGKKSYEYVIDSSSIIDPSDISVLQDEKGKNEITLVTCTLDGKQRIVLKGKLNQSKEAV